MIPSLTGSMPKAFQPSVVDRVLPVVGLATPLVGFFASKGTVILLAVVMLAALADMVRGYRPPWPFGRVIPGLTCLLLAWSGLSAVWEFAPGLALPKTLQLLGLAIAGIIALTGLGAASSKAVRWTAWGLFAGMAIGLMITVADRSTSCGVTDWSNALRGRPPVDACLMFRYKVGVTVSALLSLPAILWFWLRGRRWISLVLAILLMAGALSAGSQTAVLCVGSGALAFMAFRCWRRAAMVVLAIFAVVSIAFAPAVESRLPDSRQAVEAWHHFPSSLSHRLTIWAFTNKHIAERPLLGWGADASRAIVGGDENGDVYWYDESAKSIRNTPAPQLPLHPHNNGLQIWLELGGVGAVVYTACLLALIARLGQVRSAHRRSAAFALLSMVLTAGLTSFGVWQSWWLATICLAVGFTHVLTRDRSCVE